ESAWREFRRSRFEKPPVFFYRPLSIDPALLKRQLYLIPVERIEDPTLAYLFRQKQDELDRQITLLADVDTPRFLQESLQVYGGVSDWLLEHAQELLDRVPTRSGDDSKGGQLTATEFARRAQEELGYYQQRCGDFVAKVSVRDDMYAGLMVSGDQLLIGGRTRIPRRRVDALLQHEIGTHLITRYNGQHQPFRQLEVGLAGYDGFQEGLAVLAEYLVGGLSRFRMRVLAARVVGARLMLNGASFIDTFRTLDRNYEFSQRTAYTIAMRLYRGGGLTKDAVYLRGLLQILRYLREGGDLEPLFIGKVASSHLPFITELSMREIIKPPALRPRYLESAAAQKRIERLRGGMKILELMP
ncbi:MAG TPA: flavohemoglobin expression-modulating QEGLA motif protein, partial [Lacipirellulaceae bacterium]|nr:flavohemoglobin expression-modulating QEGLA motif protein [Lacipirellulaceae bacterium]